jgi:hypothetical protein
MNLMSRSFRRLGSILGATGVFVFTVAVIPNVASAAACAPVITTDGLYSVASFKTVGTCEWTVPSNITSVTYLVVGGGGGGHSGGGGGGGVITNHGVSFLTVTPNAQMSVVVGAGGVNGGGGNGDNSVSATSGGNSTFGAITAIGGGFGGTRSRDPADGGSGGGGGWDNSGQRISLGTAGQGNSGGRSNQNSYGAGGGGGGAGGAGTNAPAQHLGGAGGIGVSSTITGSSVSYGGGGGGGVNANCGCLHPNGGGAGGAGGGGNGSSLGHGGGAFFDGTAGAANTGGGGGGTDPESSLAGNGGSGIVIVRYLASSVPANTGVPTISGTARTGSTLTTTSTGTWSGSPTSYSYQWKRSATSGGTYSDIASATASTYVVTEFDVGYFIKLAVVATNGVGSSSAALSDPTTVVIDIAPTNTALPVITGTARTGETLTTSRGSWTSSPSTYTYQWKRASTIGGSYTNIASATDRTYDLTDADIDKFIKVSVIATNIIGASSAVLSAATSAVIDLTDSVVPTATTPVATATGFTFTISNYSNSYNYAVTTTKGTVSRTTDDVTVTGLTAGESATVTISVTRSLYKPASKTVTGSAIPAATTTTTAAPALSIVIQAPATTVAQGQISVATVAPTTTTLPVLAANGLPVPTTTTSTTIAPARARTVVTTTLPRIVTTTTLGPPVIDKVDAGQSAVQVDGVKTAAVVTRSNNQMVVTSGSLSATLSGLDKTGKRAALDSNGVVHLDVGDVIKISLGGFKPESIVEVWLFSTPTKLGTAEVGSDGKMTGEYKLPFGTKSGAHRVVVTAKLPNGKPTTFTLGILVGDMSTTSTLTRVLIAIPISLAIGFGFLLPTRLRRRRKALPA